MGKLKKFFHASRSIFKPGDIISPNPYWQHWGGWVIYATLSPTVHWTLWACGDLSLGKVRYNVYQVRPINPKTKIKWGTWDECLIHGPVEVVRCLGEANKNGRCSWVKLDNHGMRLKYGHFKGYVWPKPATDEPSGQAKRIEKPDE